MDRRRSRDRNTTLGAPLTPDPGGRPDDHSLPARRKVVFWTITLLIGAAGAVAVGEVGARLIRGRRLTPQELGERLRRSEHTEVNVVTTGNLRGLVRPSEAPGIVYELKPSRHWIFQGAETRTNSHGFRGPEWTTERPSDTLRVVGLGDSVMFGWGVDQGAIYTAQLEGLLQGAIPGKRVEVLNCAVPGYNSAQEVATFQHRCSRFEPNVVLLGYVLNDWTEPFFVRPPGEDRLVDSSALAGWIQEGTYKQREGVTFDESTGAQQTASSLRRLAGLTRDRHLPVVFFVAPDPGANPATVPDERLARTLGFTVIDVAGAMRQQRPLSELVLSRQDAHPNAAGHRLIAEILRPVILRALIASNSGS